MTNSLILHEGNSNEFAVLAAPESMEMLSEALDMGLQDHKLPLVKVPGSAGTTWDVPLMTGEEISSKEIDVVIVWASTGHRTYYEAAYGTSQDDTPPDCSSEADAKGYGSMTKDGPKEIRACAGCPKNEFGTAHNGVGKACSENIFLYCITPEEMLPIRVRVSPGSLDSFKTYAIGCMSKGVRLTQIITRMTLEKVKAKADYARIKFSLQMRLDPSQAKSAKSIGDTLKEKTLRKTAEQLQAWDAGQSGESSPDNVSVSEDGEDPFGG